jgi:hypothetical protein
MPAAVSTRTTRTRTISKALSPFLAVPISDPRRQATPQRAGGEVLLLGIDSIDGRLRVSGEEGDEALGLGLSVADEAGARLVIHSLSRASQRRHKHGNKRQEMRCERHWSLLSTV